MSFSSNLGELNLGEFNLGDITTSSVSSSFNLSFSLSSTGLVENPVLGDLSYPISTLSGTGYCYLISGGLTYPNLSLLGISYPLLTATGGLSIPLFSMAGLASCLLITGGLSFTFELAGSGRNINGQGGPTLPRFSQSITGIVAYDQGGLAYRMTLAAAGAVSMPGSGGLSLPMFSLLGEAYEHNQTFSDEEYIRRSLNDTIGLDKDQNPVDPTYIEPADNATTDYLKNFLGVGH